jgi:hypothetical protein
MKWIDSARKEREIQGLTKYGPVHPQTDKRCFRKEAVEELLDSLNYVSWANKKGELTRIQHRTLDRNIRATLRALQMACEDRFQWATEYLLKEGLG